MRLKVSITAILICFLSLFSTVNIVRINEIGIAKNFITKNIWFQDKPGIYFTSPFTMVSTIYTRPFRVGVHSGGRCTNSMLVQFKKEHCNEFIKVQGWHFYWWSNRLSFNSGYPEEYRGFKDIIRGFAYSSKKYPFIDIIEKYEDK